jgi:hypothetical protein
VPPGVVTVTLTGPGVRAGVVAVIVVGETTRNAFALVLPNRTAVAPVRPEPVIVTDAPPVAGPVRGDSVAREGTGVT